MTGPRFGGVAKTIVSDVAEADEIELTHPPTMFPAGTGSKFAPEITSVVEATSSPAQLVETVGGTMTVATTTAAPLDPPNDVATAFSGPEVVDSVENVTASSPSPMSRCRPRRG